MKIGELAKRSGLSAHTIRYYERIGLLPYADRDRSGQRDYDASILVWIEFLHRMKTTGMPIRDMLRYAALRGGGAATEAERRALLEQQRARVRTHLGELQDCLLVLDAKIAGYSGVKKRMKVYDAIAPGRQRKPVGTRQAGTRSVTARQVKMSFQPWPTLPLISRPMCSSFRSATSIHDPD